jgi:5,10-methylenetetrahydromethanopterin reductase
MGIELFTPGLPHPGVVERLAESAEAAGWDGLFVVDSQNLAGDPFVGLTLAARVTTHLLLGTGVSNPTTRHPAAAAAAIAGVHAASGGRAVFGVGRGDSALAHLGLAPASVVELERFVVTVRAYLAGRTIPFQDLDAHHQPGARSVAELGLAGTPEGSSLHFLDPALPPPPVEVAATGPRVLDAAARSADRVLLAVGADVERVRWAVERVRAVRPDAAIGAFVNVVVHDDVAVGRELAAGGVATFARFSVMDGQVRTPIDDDGAAVLERVHASYDMNQHTRTGSAQAGQLDAGFFDRFAIVGDATHCLERLTALAALGIDRFIVTGPSLGADRAESRIARRALEAEVLPELRGAGR